MSPMQSMQSPATHMVRSVSQPNTTVRPPSAPVNGPESVPTPNQFHPTANQGTPSNTGNYGYTSPVLSPKKDGAF